MYTIWKEVWKWLNNTFMWKGNWKNENNTVGFSWTLWNSMMNKWSQKAIDHNWKRVTLKMFEPILSISGKSCIWHLQSFSFKRSMTSECNQIWTLKCNMLHYQRLKITIKLGFSDLSYSLVIALLQCLTDALSLCKLHKRKNVLEFRPMILCLMTSVLMTVIRLYFSISQIKMC